MLSGRKLELLSTQTLSGTTVSNPSSDTTTTPSGSVELITVTTTSTELLQGETESSHISDVIRTKSGSMELVTFDEATTEQTDLVQEDPNSSAIWILLGVSAGIIVIVLVVGFVVFTIMKNKAGGGGDGQVGRPTDEFVSARDATVPMPSISQDYGRISAIQRESGAKQSHYAPVSSIEPDYASVLSAQAKHDQQNHYEDVGML